MKKKKKKTTGIPLNLHNVFSVIKTLEAKADHIKKKMSQKKEDTHLSVVKQTGKNTSRGERGLFFRGTQMMRLEWAENEFSTKCIFFPFTRNCDKHGKFCSSLNQKSTKFVRKCFGLNSIVETLSWVC